MTVLKNTEFLLKLKAQSVVSIILSQAKPSKV